MTSAPPESPLLTDAELAALVDKGHALHAAITSNGIRLKAINEQLQAHALSVPSQHVKLVNEDREGTRYIAQGTEGREVSVVCTSDLITQTLADDPFNAQLSAIKELAGPAFGQFYKKVTSFTVCFSKANKFDGKQFREAARASIADPERFISACIRRNKDGIPVSQIKVEW